MKTHITKYYFQDKDSGREIAAYGDSKEDAHQSISHPEDFEFVRTEEVPYNLAPVITGILDALGSDWNAEPNSNEWADCGFYLRRSDGLELFAREEWRGGGKLTFSYSAPTTSKRKQVDVWNEGEKLVRPSIGASLSKSGDKLAADITRRLLPDCEKVHPLWLEAVAKEESYYIKREQAQEVADGLKGVQGIYFTASGPSVSLSGTVDPETARKIHAFLEALNESPDSNTFPVTVFGCTREQAAEVLRERLGHDEDYGFDYALSW